MCEDCTLLTPLEGFPLCASCLEERLVAAIRGEQAKEGFQPCFKSGAIFCDRDCKYKKLCLLQGWADSCAVLDACRSIQYKEGNPACCGKNGSTCFSESRCRFGLICSPWVSGWISKRDRELGRFRQIGLAD